MLTVLLIETAMGRKLPKSTQGRLDDFTTLLFVLATSRIFLSDVSKQLDIDALLGNVQLYGPQALSALAAGAGTAGILESLENNGDNGIDVDGRKKGNKLSRSSRSRENPKPRLKLRRSGSQRSQQQRIKRGNAQPDVNDNRGLLLRSDQRSLRSAQRQRSNVKSKVGTARGWWWEG